MQTKRRKLGKLTIEETVLDAEGQAKQRALNEAVLLEYAEKRTLTGAKLREQVARYEEEILDHVID